jgi:hypothetical protein
LRPEGAWPESISETKDEIFRLLRSLPGGELGRRAASRRSGAVPGHERGEAVSRTLRELDKLRRREEALELRLLEERMDRAVEQLERRIAQVEEKLAAGGEAPIPEQALLRDRPPPRREARPSGPEAAGLQGRLPRPEATGPGEKLPRPDARIREATSAPRRGGRQLLAGEIKEGFLSDVLQLVSSGEKTGVFSVETEGRRVELYFRAGTQYHAAGEGLAGEAAFFALMTVLDGCFSFEETSDLPEETTITADTHFLILESLVKMDEEKASDEEAAEAGKEAPRSADDGSAVGPENEPETPVLDALLAAARQPEASGEKGPDASSAPPAEPAAEDKPPAGEGQAAKE